MDRRDLTSLCATLMAISAHAQVPDKCFEIERILVDACAPAALCPGSTEGMNEMVRFRVGNDPIAIADIDVQWPNNSFLGFQQDAATAALTAELNATIQACGFLVEPPEGVIPPGASVLAITSTTMCTAANSFSALNDTLHIIFQAAGNSNGHFANHTNGADVVPAPVAPSELRTLILTHVPSACGDTATYDRAQLVNVYGTYGGLSAENDGSTAVFSWPGIPTASYVNLGCQAPFVPVTAQITDVVGSLCGGGSVVLTAAATGDITGVLWQGGLGSFSDAFATTTSYTPGGGETGLVELFFCAQTGCGEDVCASILLPAGDGPTISISGDLEPCAGGSTELTASGAENYLWSTGEQSASITVFAAGTYTVSGSNACGTTEAGVDVLFVTEPTAGIEGSGFLCPVAELTATGGGAYLWSTGEDNPVITVDAPGTVSVTVTNACGSDEASIEVVELDIQSAFQPSTILGDAPLSVIFTNQSQPQDAAFTWDFGDGNGSTDTSPEHIFIQPGTYTVTLTATVAECSASSALSITVFGSEAQESAVSVPNVFTPNGDGVNDVLEVEVVNIVSMEVSIYNRWGQLVGLLERPRQVWDARSYAGEPAPEGTYFYVLTAQGGDGRSHDLRGSFTLVR